MQVYYDAYQEGVWFEGLHPFLHDLPLLPFPRARAGASTPLEAVLAYDRPDVVLTDDEDHPLLVVERTVEVPSGHNVGQRFARIVQAARCGVPAVYIGPYAAVKHGGITSGPRYMNLRLFKAVDIVIAVERSPITTIRWPVDPAYELVMDPSKDNRIRSYMAMFIRLVRAGSSREAIRTAILCSSYEQEQEEERRTFIANEIRRPEQYEDPPHSVRIGNAGAQPELQGTKLARDTPVVVYQIGMSSIRSDPYTGMSILYAYLYCGGMVDRHHQLILHMPDVSIAQWETAAGGKVRKDIRIFREVADGIRFRDGFRFKGDL